MKYTYKTQGVCASEITFDINNDIVSNVSFRGGCNGNLKAIGKLVEGMKAQELIKKLAGNTCGWKQTSCADQLAIAIENALNESENK